MPKDEPPPPPLVRLASGEPAFLLCWELLEQSGEWWAWTTRIRASQGRPHKLTVSVPAAGLDPQEDDAAAYNAVPRRVRGRDGVIRAWTATAGNEA
jgi:hypothetical protein